MKTDHWSFGLAICAVIAGFLIWTMIPGRFVWPRNAAGGAMAMGLFWTFACVFVAILVEEVDVPYRQTGYFSVMLLLALASGALMIFVTSRIPQTMWHIGQIAFGVSSVLVVLMMLVDAFKVVAAEDHRRARVAGH